MSYETHKLTSTKRPSHKSTSLPTPMPATSFGSSQYDQSVDIYNYFLSQAKKYGLKGAISRYRQSGVPITIKPTTEAKGLASFKKELLNMWREPGDEIVSDKAINSIKNADEAFAFLQDISWDLHGAAPFVANAFDINLKPSPATTSTETGIYCAILRLKGIVKSEESFHHFST